jgi:hypothetical protein
MISRKSRLGIVDFSSEYDNEQQPKSHCRECMKYGFFVPLKNRIYPDNEPIPVDHDQFLQCHECGTIVPIYEIEKQSKITDVKEITDNPFDIGTSYLGIDSRTSVGGQECKKEKRETKTVG